MHPLLQTDVYKVSHKGFMPEGTTKIYSNFTARSSKYLNVIKDKFDDKTVWFGLQYFVKDFLIREWNESFFDKPKEEVISKFKRIIDAHVGKDSVDMGHFEQLHDLGYLPIEIKSLAEGSRVNIKVPFLTITNTHPDFAWLTNYLETVMSQELWKPTTAATIAYEFRKLVNEWAVKTTGSRVGTEFQLHDFSARGMAGRHDSAINGSAFLLSSNGTDTIAAIELLEDFYNANVEKEFVGCSIPASEHSVACLGTAVDNELAAYKKWITEDYPSGLVSLVSDTYDYWRVLTEYLPVLKEDILARPVNALGLSKVVIRPDSGNPADIICGTVEKSFETLDQAIGDINDEHFEEAAEDCEGSYNIGCESYSTNVYIKNEAKYYTLTTPFNYNRHDKQYYYIDNYDVGAGKTTAKEFEPTAEVKGSIQLLWEMFGGTVTEQGYKVLDSHIGLIYGDSITLPVAQEIFQRLEAKGFASSNVVFGVGSYSLSYTSRDSIGAAVKATYAEIDGKGYELFKDPITDSGMKKSAKGLIRVEKAGEDFVLYDQQTVEQEKQGVLETVFLNGKLVKETSLSEIRNNLWSK